MTLATYQIVTHRPRQERRVPALQAVRPARLGPDHLRRGPPAAGAGLPRDGPDPGPPPARPDGDAGPRGRPRGGRLQPDRPEEVRRALARAGDAAAGSPRRPAPRSASPCRSRCAWNTPSPSGATSTASPARTRPRTTSSAGSCERYPDSRVLIIGQYLKQLRSLAQALRHAAHHRPDGQRRARGPLRQVPPRRGAAADPVEGRQLRHRPAGRQRADPGLGHVRLAPGGGAAAGPDPAAQGERRGRPTSTRW